MLYRLLSFAPARRLFAHLPALLALVALCTSVLGLPATITHAAIIGQVKDISPGSGDSDPAVLTNVNGTLFFQAYDGISGTELWNVTLAPTLTMRGNSQPIAAGSSTPTVTNHTDFGSSVVGQALVRTFTITNTGDAALTLTSSSPVTISGMAAGDFSVTQAPTTSLAPGGSTTVAITFTPSAVGTRSATISIASNASSTNPFTFAIQGAGGQQSQVYLPLVLR